MGGSLREWQRGIGMGRSPVDYLLLPVRVVLMGGQGYERFEGQIHRLWMIWIPLSLWGARSSDLARGCLWIAGLYFVFWSLTSQQMRFLIAILPFLATTTACSIAEILKRLERGGKHVVAEAVVTLLVVGSGLSATSWVVGEPPEPTCKKAAPCGRQWYIRPTVSSTSSSPAWLVC